MFFSFSNCIHQVLTHTSQCPECGVPMWKRDLNQNRQLNNVVKNLNFIKRIVSLDTSSQVSDSLLPSINCENLGDRRIMPDSSNAILPHTSGLFSSDVSCSSSINLRLQNEVPNIINAQDDELGPVSRERANVHCNFRRAPSLNLEPSVGIEGTSKYKDILATCDDTSVGSTDTDVSGNTTLSGTTWKCQSKSSCLNSCKPVNCHDLSFDCTSKRCQGADVVPRLSSPLKSKRKVKERSDSQYSVKTSPDLSDLLTPRKPDLNISDELESVLGATSPSCPLDNIPANIKRRHCYSSKWSRGNQADNSSVQSPSNKIDTVSQCSKDKKG